MPFAKRCSKGPDGVPSAREFVAGLSESPDAWGFVLAYFAAGFGLALLVYASSAGTDWP